MTTKRKAADGGSAGLQKRQAIESPPLTDSKADPENVDDSHSIFSEVTGQSQSNDDLPTAADTTLTAPSTSSRRSRKFPSDLKTIRCLYPDCPKTFNRPARLAAHLRSHNNERPFKCTYDDCDKAYFEEKHLKQHIKGSHTKERKYVCEEPGCGASFTTGTRLRRHADVHAGAERFRCREYPPCDKTFRKHQTLQRHIRTDHLGQAAYSCDVDSCAAGFDTPGALKRHTQREHGEVRFWCDECGIQDVAEGEDGDEDGDGGLMPVGFTTLALLNAHVRQNHVSCHFCDARCGSKGDLELHIEACHSGTTRPTTTTTTASGMGGKTVVCTWQGCGRTFVKQSNLAAHVRTAHEGFRFVCGVVDLSRSTGLANWNEAEEGCGEGFTTKVKLEHHVRYVHLGMKRPKTAVPIADPDVDYIGEIVGFSGPKQQEKALRPVSDRAAHVDTIYDVVAPGGGESMSLDRHDELYPAHVLAAPSAEGGAADESLEEMFWIEAPQSPQPLDGGFAGDWEQMRQLIDFGGEE